MKTKDPRIALTAQLAVDYLLLYPRPALTAG
jgi:hypothetical protein